MMMLERSPSLATRAHPVTAARELGLQLRGVWLPPAVGIDAIPFHHNGVDCLTFSSGSLGHATLAVHSAGDSAENLDPDTLARIALLARTTALKVCNSRTHDGLRA